MTRSSNVRRHDVGDEEEEEGDIFGEVGSEVNNSSDEEEEQTKNSSSIEPVEENFAQDDSVDLFIDNPAKLPSDKKDPCFVPKGGRYFLHDDRIDLELSTRQNSPTNKENRWLPKTSETAEEAESHDTSTKRTLWDPTNKMKDTKWQHDRYLELMNEPSVPRARPRRNRKPNRRNGRNEPLQILSQSGKVLPDSGEARYNNLPVHETSTEKQRELAPYRQQRKSEGMRGWQPRAKWAPKRTQRSPDMPKDPQKQKDRNLISGENLVITPKAPADDSAKSLGYDESHRTQPSGVTNEDRKHVVPHGTPEAQPPCYSNYPLNESSSQAESYHMVPVYGGSVPPRMLHCGVYNGPPHGIMQYSPNDPQPFRTYENPYVTYSAPNYHYRPESDHLPHYQNVPDYVYYRPNDPQMYQIYQDSKVEASDRIRYTYDAENANYVG